MQICMVNMDIQTSQRPMGGVIGVLNGNYTAVLFITFPTSLFSYSSPYQPPLTHSHTESYQYRKERKMSTLTMLKGRMWKM